MGAPTARSTRLTQVADGAVYRGMHKVWVDAGEPPSGIEERGSLPWCPAKWEAPSVRVRQNAIAIQGAGERRRVGSAEKPGTRQVARGATKPTGSEVI